MKDVGKVEKKKKRDIIDDYQAILVTKENYLKHEGDMFEEAITLFGSLSWREILALHRIRELTLQHATLLNKIAPHDTNFREKLIPLHNHINSFLKKELKVEYPNIFLKKLENTGLIHPIIYEESFRRTTYRSNIYFEELYKNFKELEKHMEKTLSKKHTI